MTTHKEIAGWLREAATKAALLKLYQECSHEESLCEENVWLDRATLVESMPDLEEINKELVEALEGIIHDVEYDQYVSSYTLEVAIDALKNAKEGM